MRTMWLIPGRNDTSPGVLFTGRSRAGSTLSSRTPWIWTSEYILTEFLESFMGGRPISPRPFMWKPPRTRSSSPLLSLKAGARIVEICGDKKKPRAGQTQRRSHLIRLQASSREKELGEEALAALAELLELSEFPVRIESYDISNIAGIDSVGSMVVFEDGKPKPSDYRRFKIKTVKGANDYDSLREIMLRRFKRGIAEICEIQAEKIQFTHGKFSFPGPHFDGWGKRTGQYGFGSDAGIEPGDSRSRPGQG